MKTITKMLPALLLAFPVVAVGEIIPLQWECDFKFPRHPGMIEIKKIQVDGQTQFSVTMGGNKIHADYQPSGAAKFDRWNLYAQNTLFGLKINRSTGSAILVNVNNKTVKTVCSRIDED